MSLKKFNLFNDVLGWLVFVIASITYLMTMEPTVPLWDCGEFIAGSYKLEVVHPPGAPFFLMFNHVFTLFAPDPTWVPKIINGLSGIESALAILFLFWSSTMLSRKFFIKDENNISLGESIAVFGAGLVGALAFTFSDTVWFSAVEAEVYGMSLTFTALVFWLLLKWDRRADEPNNLRWLILVFFMMGISIGVHLLSLLSLPVLAFFIYFRKYKKATPRGVLYAFIAGMIILLVINTGVIKWVPAIATYFELLFVNSFGLPYWSGVLFWIFVLFAAIAYGIYYTQKNQMVLLNTMLAALLVVLIGYSSYTMVPIRSLANPPIDYSNPDNIFSMLSYINREQYGDRPLMYGAHFAAEPIGYKEGRMRYIQKDGKYLPTVRKFSPKYKSEDKMLFPRLGDTRADRIDGYRSWSGMRKGQKNPNFSDNIRFFIRYQLGFMYGRYFAWNFIGRQNDEQGNGKFIVPVGFMDGNWISGIKFIDDKLIGKQDKSVYAQRINKAHNTLFFLPFILGILGMIYHYRKNKRDAISTFMLFFITGILLIVYQNSPPFEPRERDYTLVGSFYVFGIWIGFGVFMIIDYLSKKLKLAQAAAIATVAGFLAGPVLMASQEYDDHNRSHRYTSRDYGINYLESCAPNAILFTNGDNDTYPLWYNQEVEGNRDDVRVINLQLLMTDWYMEQLKLPKNNSTAIKFSFTKEQLAEGIRDYVPFYENPSLGIDAGAYYDLKEILSFIGSDDPRTKAQTSNGTSLDFYPTSQFKIPVNKEEVLKYKVIRPAYADRIADDVLFSVGKRTMFKNHILSLDIIANNLWERPVYFAITSGSDTYLGLNRYFQQEGLAYRIVPVYKTDTEEQAGGGETGRIDPLIMYENMVHKFQWGNINYPGVYICSVTRRQALNYRNVFGSLARSLMAINEKEKAVKTVDRCLEVLPEDKVPHQINSVPMVEVYFMCGEKEKGVKLADRLIEVFVEYLEYYKSLDKKFFKMTDEEVRRNFYGLQVLQNMGSRYNVKEIGDKATAELEKLQLMYGYQ